MRKRILSIFLMLILTLSAVGMQPSMEAIAANTDGRVENGSLILDMDVDTGEFSIEDKRTGAIWYSNPVNADQDPLANGIPKMSLQSQIVLTYLDKKSQDSQATSTVSVLQNGELKCEVIDNGFLFTYNFIKEGFEIPVKYVLEDDYLQVSVPLNEIKITGENTLTGVRVLPYFGAGSTEDTGYIFIPDGSGAIINYNNGKTFAKEFHGEVYGRDMALSREAAPEIKQEIRMPVFGMQNNDAAFLAVIHEGASKSNIYASVSGSTTSYNTVYSEAEYRIYDTVRLQDKSFQVKNVRYAEQNSMENANFELRYYFLEQADYSGMAARYRQYLIDEQGLTQKTNGADMAMYLQIYGSVPITKSFLGIPFDVIQPLTTFEQCEEIVRTLNEQGIYNLKVRYTGWEKGGYQTKMPLNLKVEGKLGGTKGFQQLEQNLADMGAKLFPNVDFLNIYKDGNGVSRFSDAVKTINGSPAYQYGYELNTLQKDPEVEPWSLLSPQSIGEVVEKFVKKNDLSENLSISSLGTYSYSDFRKNGVTRYEAEKMWEDAISTLSAAEGELMAENVNAYALPYVDYIVNVPVESSHYDIEDYSVPFYQMVIHGMIPYALPPINLESDPQNMLLKSLETGAALNYAWMAENSSVLKDTQFNNLYSAEYRTWINSAVNDYKIVNSILSSVSDQAIIQHRRLAPDVYETTYENGIQIITNYSSADYIGTGVKTLAGSYSLVKGGD
jgi:hypothetical protein